MRILTILLLFISINCFSQQGNAGFTVGDSQACCEFTIGTDRGGIQNSIFFKNFEYGPFTGATWAELQSAIRFNGGNIFSNCLEASCHITRFEICGLPHGNFSYEDENGDRQEIITTCTFTDLRRYETECCNDGEGIFFDISQTGFRCSKIGFVIDNAFTSLCPDGWTCEQLAETLNEGNPTGTTFACDNGNLIVTDGNTPELIQFFHSGGGETTVRPEGSDGECKPCLSTKDCNSDAILAQLEAINENTCDNRTESNVVCASTNQTGLALFSGGTVDLVAGQELIVGRVLDCSDNPQSFSVSTLLNGQLEEIEDPVDAGICPSDPPAPIDLGCIKDEKGIEWQVFQTTLNGEEVIYYVDINGKTGTPNGDAENFTACGEEAFAIICKPGCVKGVQVDVVIGYNSTGNVIFYKDANGNNVTADFESDCPPRECTTESLNICADGDYESINDGDDFLGVFQTCNDGTTELLSMVSFDDLSTNIEIPSNFAFTFCAGSELEFTGCFVDSDGTRWNAFIVNGTDQAYQNIESGAFGTPSGELSPCEDNQEVVDAIDDKHCIRIGENEFKAFLILNKDGSLSAKVLGGQLYPEGEYSLISCCPSEDVRTTHFAGFTATRPTNTPNNGWNNEFTTGSTPIVGDFRLCTTISGTTGNTANMLGINSDPTTNASWNTIDCALYIRDLNGQQNLYHYENGSFQGFIGTQNIEGQEICYVRTGGVVTFELNGNQLNYTNGNIAECNIGTGPVFLDDSHYFANGTWGNGSITYSDFELVQLSGDDNDIKSVSECCCESSGGGSISWNDIQDIPSDIADGDDNTTYSFTSEELSHNWAEARGYNNAVEYQRQATVTNISNGLFNVIFNAPHPDGTRYTVTWGAEEDANRDVPKQHIVRGTQTANGFQFYNTVDDNGGTADIPDPSGWHFQVSGLIPVITTAIED